MLACFLSFVLVLHFLNPAFANETDEGQKEPVSFGKVFSDIFSNLKEILGGLSGNESPKEEEEFLPPPAPIQPSEPTPSPAPPSSFEGDIEGVNIPARDDQAPESLGSDEATGSTETGNIVNEIPVIVPNETNSPDFDSSGGDSVEESSPAMENRPTFDSSGVQIQEEPSPAMENIQNQEVPNETDLRENNQASSEIGLEIQAKMAPFRYENPDLPNPFVNPNRKSPGGEEMKVVVPKTPPEMYTLEEIQLRGIIWNTKSPKALIELPGKEGHYSLIKGDKIGKNGIIFEIREDEVIIVETFYKDKDTTENVIIIKPMDRLGLNRGSTN